MQDEKLPQLISNGVDFFATICDWTGAEKPESTTGKSFRKIAEEGNPQAPPPRLCHHRNTFRRQQKHVAGWYVPNVTNTCCTTKEDTANNLFDMQNDRGETRNLMMENAYEKVAQQHRDILENYMNTYKIKPTRPKLHDVPGKRFLKRQTPTHPTNLITILIT